MQTLPPTHREAYPFPYHVSTWSVPSTVIDSGCCDRERGRAPAHPPALPVLRFLARAAQQSGPGELFPRRGA